MTNGSIPADGGNLILSLADKEELEKDIAAAVWIRPYVGAEDFIHGRERYCLWLADCPPGELRAMPQVMKRVTAVREMRLASRKAATREKAKIPALFTENRQPKSGHYLALPRTSSEHRAYIPIGFLPATTIAANDLQIVPDATDYEFGVLSSAMHMAWAHTTAGRLKSDIRYSAKFTYNTFPWPEPTGPQRKKIEEKAKAVLDARAKFPASSLADLYDPNTMPPALLKAHRELDKAVDTAYRKTPFRDERTRIKYLFELYQKIYSPLMAKKKKRKQATT